MSLALAHKRRTLAQGSATLAASAAPAAYSSAAALTSPANAQKHYKLMEDALLVDLERLSGFNSLEQRQVIKRDELLPKYLEYIGRYRESGLNFPNQVLMYVLVDRLHLNDLVVKISVNILVIILNYVASKLLIFRKKNA